MKYPLQPYALITRPGTKATLLQELLKAHGIASECYPSIIIKPMPDAQIAQQFMQLNQADLIIFISANAVNFSHNHWPTFANQPIIMAVGPDTNAALQQAGMHSIIAPKQLANSEALLALPELTQVQGKKISIISGLGGRDLLEKELARRGAVVSKIAVYQRQPAKHPQAETLAGWQQQVNLIITTSNEGLANFYNLLPKTAKTWALTCQLLVVSERGKQLAHAFGFRQIILAKNASNQAILQAIRS